MRLKGNLSSTNLTSKMSTGARYPEEYIVSALAGAKLVWIGRTHIGRNMEKDDRCQEKALAGHNDYCMWLLFIYDY